MSDLTKLVAMLRLAKVVDYVRDASFAAGQAAERAKAFNESADYIQGYAQAVRRAGHTDTANTLVAVMTSVREMAQRKATPPPARVPTEAGAEMVKRHHRLSMCSASTGLCGRMTFGSGKLDEYGYWEHPCRQCAEAHEQEHGEAAWPAEQPAPAPADVQHTGNSLGMDLDCNCAKCVETRRYLHEKHLGPIEAAPADEEHPDNKLVDGLLAKARTKEWRPIEAAPADPSRAAVDELTRENRDAYATGLSDAQIAETLARCERHRDDPTPAYTSAQVLDLVSGLRRPADQGLSEERLRSMTHALSMANVVCPSCDGPDAPPENCLCSTAQEAKHKIIDFYFAELLNEVRRLRKAGAR